MAISDAELKALRGLIAKVRGDLVKNKRAVESFHLLCDRGCDADTLILFLCEASDVLSREGVPADGRKGLKAESLWQSLGYGGVDAMVRGFPGRARKLADDIR